MNMQNHDNKQRKGIFSSFIGEATPAKASGLTYSMTTFISVVLAFIFLMIITVGGLAKEGYEEADWYLYCSYLLTPMAFALVAVFILRWSNTSWKQAVKEQKCKPKYFLIAVLLQIGLLCLSELNAWFLELLSGIGYQDQPIQLPSMDGFGFVAVLFVIAVLPAVMEEVIFRGLLLKGMRVFGTVGAILLNGALFALYHQNPAQTLYQFCCGAAFALVAYRAGSILPTILSHFINNALILTLTKFGIDTFPTPIFTGIMIVSGACLILSLVWLIFLDKNKPEMEANLQKKSEKRRFWQFSAAGIALCALTWLSVLLSGL